MAKQFTGSIAIVLRIYRLPQYSLLTLSRIQLRSKLLCPCKTQTIRTFRSRAISNDYESDNKIIDKKCMLPSTINQSLINSLSNALSIDNNEALEIITDIAATKLITSISENDIPYVVAIAQEAGVSIPEIKKHIPLLLNNRAVLKEKFLCLKRLKEDINKLLPLLDTNLDYLRKLIISDIVETEMGQENKFRYLTNELKCDVYTLCEKAAKMPIICTIPVNKIKETMSLLKEYNFDRESISNNLWLFKYNTATIRKRLFRIKQAGVVDQMKPWIIRCSLNGLYRYLSFSKKNNQIQNIYSSHANVISKKLNISIEEAEFFIKRSPPIMEIHVDKISEVLDVLLEYGYDTVDILTYYRIFLLKTELLKKRLEKLKNLKGYHRLTLVYCSNKTFQKNWKRASEMYKKENLDESTGNQ